VVNALFFVYCWLVFVPLMVLATVALWILCMALSPFVGPRRAGRLTAVPWSRLGLLLSGVSVHIHGREQLDPDQSYVIVANHLSQYDIWVLYGHLGVDFRWVMKQELRRVPLIGYACEVLGHIFIDRSNHEQALASLENAKRQLVGGTSILFFPEGTRSRSGELLAFKKGAFRMAQDLELPILPVTLTGTRDILPPDTLRMQPGPARITLHTPIIVDGDDEQAVENAMAISRRAIASALESGQFSPQPDSH
jgi:1-acyl-sn-glycerol-3-phosphate acyltransferase